MVTIEKEEIRVTADSMKNSLLLPSRMWEWTRDTFEDQKNTIKALEKQNQSLLEELKLFRSSSTSDIHSLVDLSSEGFTEETNLSGEFPIDPCSFDGQPWSLENCIESIFQAHTTHYLSEALLVNTFMQAGIR